MSEQQRGTLGLAAVAAAAVGLLGFAVGATAGARAARREKEEQAPKLLSVNSSQSQRQSSLPAPSAAASLDLWTSMSWGDERKVGKEEGGLVVASTAKTRIESDLLGELQIPADSYFGIQTLRAASNYQITGIPLSHFPDFIAALALVKKSCALANGKVGSLEPRLVTAITATCDEIVGGALHPEFIVDMVQGGAGTSTNMNANEVIANRALELLGQEKGSYEHCHPNDHVNKSQSTNDAYPTACKLAILLKQRALCEKMEALVASLRRKGREFAGVLKMGRTQLQDAVPMTLGQEFDSWANVIAKDIASVRYHGKKLLSINLGGTAIGTGICANPAFGAEATAELSRQSGMEFTLAEDLIEASSCVDGMATFSGTLRRVAIKLSKVCSDLRLLSSGPRCGINEINLPPMAPGSSIMPGKVNPIIPEVVNQVAFAVCGNDLTVMMAAEHGQLQLNVFEPVMVLSIFQSIDMLTRAFHTLQHRCIDGITANEAHCAALVKNSIGIVTALLPEIGYKKASHAAKTALRDGSSVVDVVLAEGHMTKERMDEVMQPANMVGNAYTNETKVTRRNGRSASISIDLLAGSAYGVKT